MVILEGKFVSLVLLIVYIVISVVLFKLKIVVFIGIDILVLFLLIFNVLLDNLELLYVLLIVR